MLFRESDLGIFWIWTWLGYRIPVNTLSPSLVLVKRLFLSGKFIPGNITYLLTIFILVVNVNPHVLIDHFSSCRVLVGVIVLLLRHTHAQDCPAWACRNQWKNTYIRVSFSI